MPNQSLETAYSLLELLEFSLGVENQANGLKLPMNGIREVITQVKGVVGANLPQANTQSDISVRPKAKLVPQVASMDFQGAELQEADETKAMNNPNKMSTPVHTITSQIESLYQENLGRDRTLSESLYSDDSSENLSASDEDRYQENIVANGSLERMAFMNIPKVRTVSPNIRGKIRELVGIESDDVNQSEF